MVPTFGDLMLRICWFTYHTHTPETNMEPENEVFQKGISSSKGAPIFRFRGSFSGCFSIYEFHHIFLLKKLIRIWKDFRVGSSTFTNENSGSLLLNKGVFLGLLLMEVSLPKTNKTRPAPESL